MLDCCVTSTFWPKSVDQTELWRDKTLTTKSGGCITVYIGRILLFLALLALPAAWLTQLIGGPLFGMSQQHFISDATVLALLGI